MQLVKKEMKFVFDEACPIAFKIFKEKLILAQVIIVPDWSEPFNVKCDSSGIALVVL